MVNNAISIGSVFGIPIRLHISLLMRITGDLLLQHTLRQWGGLLNAVAILLFASIIILNIVQNKVKANE